MRVLEQEAKLTFRKRRKQDESFLVQVTMAAMKQVYVKSTGVELTEEFVRQSIDGSETTMIIEQGGKPIGYYCYSIYRPGRMYWGSLILEPNVRGKGLGRQIHAQVEAEAHARHVQVIDGHVQVENKRALDFWLKNGWRIVGHAGTGSLAIQKRVGPPSVL